ncbi:MAG: hypothetical protein RIG82_13190 [Phycisphaeraceae bacterium]
MGWFERLCNHAGLAIHHVARGVREKPQPENRASTEGAGGAAPGETIQRVRRVTIEEVEIRSRPAEQQNDPSDDRDEPPRIA